MPKSWTSYFQDKLPAIIDELKIYVEMESPTADKQAVDQLINYVTTQFTALGCESSVVLQTQYGNQVRLEYGEGEEQILILGHLDTVKPIGTLAREPWTVVEEKVYGPGIMDMKAGVVIAYFALQAIIEHKLPLTKKLVFFWNTDEEAGSPSSRAWIEAEAAHSACALVLEPAYGQGDLKSSRKGGGEFGLRVTGRSAHAGSEHAQGINAIEELAHQIGIIQLWTDYAQGTTLSVGTIKGGTVSNVVPETAEAQIDVRVSMKAEASRIAKQMASLTPKLAGASLEVTGGIDKYPMERTAETERLIQFAMQAACEEGFTLGEQSVGGTSDGNIAAAAGIPVLDGLGPVGDGMHASNEHIRVDLLPRQLAVLVRLLTAL